MRIRLRSIKSDLIFTRFMRTSDKNLCAVLLATVLMTWMVGCASDGSGGGSGSKNSSASSAKSAQGSRTRSGIADGEYYASNWLASRGYDPIDPALLPGNDAPIVRDSRGAPLGGGNAQANPQVAAAGTLPAAPMLRTSIPSGPVPPLPTEMQQQQAAGVWALVLATFTEGDTVAAAQRMISETARIAPQVQGLRVHPAGRGSMVVYGEYAGRDDKKVQEDRTWLRSITYENRPVFPRIALTHLDLRPLQADLHPYDLHMARREYPRVRPLYTLDIAVWDHFDTAELSYDEIRRAAERYARQLRNQGYEAYFYHDDVAKRSMVTVGLFDRRAINEVSGLYNDAVEELIRRFPIRLANGEPMFEFRDRFRPQLGVKPQTPVLGEVPD